MSKYSLEIYNSANTVKQAIIPNGAILGGDAVRELNGEDSIEFSIDRRSETWSSISQRLIVRLVDTTVVPVASRSFRIVSVREERSSENRIVGTVRAEHIKYDLAAQIHAAAEETIQQTPTTHLTKILAGSGFTVGTVTPTDRVTIPYGYNTRLYDLDQVRQASGYDLVVNENKSVDLKTQGTTSKASLRFRRNLSSLRRTMDRLQANVMYGIGGEGSIKQVMTVAEATHRITAIASTLLTLDSRKIVSSNDSLNGFYVEKPDGTFTLINDSIKQTSGNDQLDVASASGLAAGDAIKIRTSNSATARLEYVPDKASRDLYGDVQGVYKNESMQEIRNLLGPFAKSALSDTYTLGLCAGWLLVGEPTVAENTNVAFIKNGEKSQKVTVSAIAAPSNAPSVALGAAGQLTGTYQYKKTWRSSEGETTVGPASSTINPSSQKVTVSRNEISPSAHIVSWRIYRTKAGGSTFFFVADVPAATSSYDDNIPDSLLTVEVPSSNVAAGGQGVERTFTAVTDKEYASVTWVFVESGKVRVELRTGTSFYPDENVESLKKATPTRAQTTLWIVTIQGLIAAGTSGSMRIVAQDGAATFYVDAALVLQNAYAPTEGVFIGDNSATDLWHETYTALQDAKDPRLTYDVDGLDLFEYDKAGFADDEIIPGDTITVNDEELGISAQLRCVKKSFDILEPWRARFEVSNSPNRLTKQVERQKKKELDSARAVANRAVRLTQQFAVERGTSRQPTIEIAELK